MRTAQSILIVLTGSLGDLIRGLSIASALKQYNPDCTITWLVDSTWHTLIQNHPALDEILIFDRKNRVSGALKLFRELRKRGFDITLDLQRHFKSGLCSWISGAPRRIGFHPSNCKEGNQLFNSEYILEQQDSESKLLHYQAFLTKFGCDLPLEVDFGFQSIGRGAADELLPATAAVRVGIVLSSSWESKDWPFTGYQQLLGCFNGSSNTELVLLGTKSDLSTAQQLLEGYDGTPVVNLAGRTSLVQLLDVIRQCRVCVGPDSGPGHMAAAVGVPYVSLFGPTPPERVAPYGFESLVVQSGVPCSPCSRKKCPGLNTACMRLISPAVVFNRVQSVLIQASA